MYINFETAPYGYKLTIGVKDFAIGDVAELPGVADQLQEQAPAVAQQVRQEYQRRFEAVDAKTRAVFKERAALVRYFCSISGAIRPAIEEARGLESRYESEEAESLPHDTGAGWVYKPQDPGCANNTGEPQYHRTPDYHSDYPAGVCKATTPVYGTTRYASEPEPGEFCVFDAGQFRRQFFVYNESHHCYIINDSEDCSTMFVWEGPRGLFVTYDGIGISSEPCDGFVGEYYTRDTVNENGIIQTHDGPVRLVGWFYDTQEKGWDL